MDVVITLLANFIISVGAGISAFYLIIKYIPIFIQRGLYGNDMCKVEMVKTPEPMGVVSAGIYLISLFLFIPIYDWKELVSTEISSQTECSDRSIHFLSLLAGIISITTAIFLGLVDDMLDLRWLHKILFPILSSIPLLLVYYKSKNSTSMLLPTFLNDFFGHTSLDLGCIFYIYMVMLVIFCTNAINIIAGINGVEVGQSILIASSVIIFNIVQIVRLEQDMGWLHRLSLCFLLPFFSTSLALFMHNKYPAKVFVGDTYCYWAGMTLAVVGIVGRFSKTLVLFLVPQMLNFLYSLPQLFKFVPCPRHRLPKLNKATGLLEMSMAEFQLEKISILGRLFVKTFSKLHLIHYREFEKDDEKWVEINNLTILNFLLKISGPLHEEALTNRFLLFQFACSIFGFIFRFYFSYLLYEEVH